MTTMIVMTGVCLAGIAFILRFLLALSQETRRPAGQVVYVATKNQDPRFVPVGRAALKVLPVVHRSVPLNATGTETQRFAVGQR